MLPRPFGFEVCYSTKGIRFLSNRFTGRLLYRILAVVFKQFPFSREQKLCKKKSERKAGALGTQIPNKPLDAV